MTSVALQTRNTQASSALDEVVAAHRAVAGSGPGRRHATREIDHAYIVLHTFRFQRFRRDLHTEAVGCVPVQVPSSFIADLLRVLENVVPDPVLAHRMR